MMATRGMSISKAESN